MKKKKKSNIFGILVIISLVLLIGFIFFSLNQTAFTFSYSYSLDDRALGYDILKQSSKPYELTSIYPDGPDGADKSYIITTNNPLNEVFGIDHTAKTSDEGIGFHNLVKTKELNLNINELKKLVIDFSQSSSLSGCSPVTSNGNGGIYYEILLYDGENEIKIYEGKHEPWEDLPTKAKSGRITITENEGILLLDINGEKNAIEIPDGNYELAIYSYLRITDCGPWNTGSTEMKQNIKLNNIEVINKEVPTDTTTETPTDTTTGTTTTETPTQGTTPTIITVPDVDTKSVIIYITIATIIGSLVFLGYTLYRRYNK